METSGRKRKRWIMLFRMLSILLIAVFVISQVSRWRPKEIRQISGTVIGYKRTGSIMGGTPTLVVRLNSYKQIPVKIGNDVPVHIGARVVLAETETWLFGFRRYDFVRYAGATDPRRDNAGP